MPCLWGLVDKEVVLKGGRGVCVSVLGHPIHVFALVGGHLGQRQMQRGDLEVVPILLVGEISGGDVFLPIEASLRAHRELPKPCRCVEACGEAGIDGRVQGELQI